MNLSFKSLHQVSVSIRLRILTLVNGLLSVCGFILGSELLEREDHGFFLHCFKNLYLIEVNEFLNILHNRKNVPYPIRESGLSLSSWSSTSLTQARHYSSVLNSLH